jgi:hypothetical protein
VAQKVEPLFEATGARFVPPYTAHLCGLSHPALPQQMVEGPGSCPPA